MKTVVKLIRKDSAGVAGSIVNAEHHAKMILPYIHAMKNKVADLGFAIWRAGNNVHEFETEDGRRFTLRAFTRGRKDGIGNYVGVRLARRITRSEEHQVIDIESVEAVPELLSAMRLMARPSTGDASGVMSAA